MASHAYKHNLESKIEIPVPREGDSFLFSPRSIYEIPAASELATVKVKVKLSPCLTTHHVMETYGGVDVQGYIQKFPN
jgi:hypothetical protein